MRHCCQDLPLPAPLMYTKPLLLSAQICSFWRSVLVNPHVCLLPLSSDDQMRQIVGQASLHEGHAQSV